MYLARGRYSFYLFIYFFLLLNSNVFRHKIKLINGGPPNPKSPIL